MIMIKLLFLLLAIAPLHSKTAIAQAPTNQRLEEYLETARGKLEIPNMEGLVVRAEEIAFRYATDPQATFTEPFYIGSVSKSLTAFGVLRLVEDGLLELDTQVVQVLPEIEFAEYRHDITVRHLLNHTSGITKEQGFDALPTLEALDASSHTISIHFQPNSRHEYSNLNYALLGLVIEKVSGRSFRDYMSEAVFVPLHMTDVRLGTRDALAPDVIRQYQYWAGVPVASQQVRFAESSVPAGFICASSSDLANYLQMQLQDGEFQANQVLDATLLTAMRTPWNQADYGYAMGWKQGSYNGFRIYQHLGSTATSYCGIFLIPDKSVGFVLLTNTNSLSFTEQLMEGVLSILTAGEPPPVTARERWIRIAAMLVLLGFVGSFLMQLLNLFKKRHTIDRRRELGKVAALLIGFTVLYVLFPKVCGIPWVAFASIQPDIGLAIASSFALPLLSSCLRLGIPPSPASEDSEPFAITSKTDPQANLPR